MLSREHRLGNAQTIERVAKTGRSYRNDSLWFRWLKTDLPSSRFAINVSKKVDKRAAVRNRLRRQIHEALRRNLPTLKTGMDVLISARMPPKGPLPPFAVLSRAVASFFNTLNAHEK